MFQGMFDTGDEEGYNFLRRLCCREGCRGYSGEEGGGWYLDRWNKEDNKYE